MITQFINAHILTPKGWIENGSVLIENGKILNVTHLNMPVVGAEIVDCQGMHLVPGGIELHVHGGGGRDFMEGTEEAFRVAIDAHMKHGTTAIYPTMSCSTDEMYRASIETAKKLMKEPDTPIMGLHLEGPYFSTKMAGAQNPKLITPPVKETYDEYLASGVVKRWDIAPELPGAKEFIEACHAAGCVTAVGHTACDPEHVEMAYKAGCRHATHFTNAMSSLHKKREFKVAGCVEAVYAIRDFNVEVIADGIHVPPVVMRQIYNSKGVEHMCLVTDSLAVAGCPGATRTFNDNEIIEDGVCKLADRSALAGSIATMDRLLRTAVQMAGFKLEEACRMISETPARIMGIFDRKGSLEEGKDADMLLLDEDLQLQGVWAMGKKKR